MTQTPELYRTLPPMAQLVAQCYGVVHPVGLTRSSVVNLCARADIRYQGKRLTQEQAGSATRTLLDAGVAYRNHSQGVVLDTAWALPMTVAALRQGTLEAIYRAYERQQTTYGYFRHPYRLEMLVRYCVVRGRIAELESVSSIPSTAWRSLAYDETGELLGALPARYRRTAAAACLGEVIENLAPSEHVINSLSEEDTAYFADEIAFVRVLQGRFDEAECTFSDLPERTRASKRLLVAHAATRALIAMLQGDDERAFSYIDRACEMERSGTRKRNVFPLFRAFPLAMLSLVRVDTAQSMERFKQLLRAAERVDAFPWLIEFAQRARAARTNTLYGVGLHSGSAFETVLVGMVQCWLADTDIYRLGEIHQSTFRTFERGLANGYLWAAAESACAIARLAARLAEHNRAVSGNNGEIVARASKASSELHHQLGTMTLATLGKPVAGWERAIKDLEFLAYETHKKAKTKRRKPVSAAVERLAWELDVDSCGSSIVTPKLQRAIKRGGWTRGKTVSSRRLVVESGSIDCLIEQDRAVVAAIKRDAYRSNSYYADESAVFALVGHPHVVNPGGDPVEVARRDPELTIADAVGKSGEDDQLIARLEPFGDGDEPFMVVMKGDRRCEVTRFNASHQRLRDIIPPDGLKLPQHARARLIEAVTALASEVRIQSSMTGIASHSDEMEGDPGPWVQLLPSGEGLTVSLVVEPAAGSKQFFIPGKGGATVYVVAADGRVMQVRRDLQAEREQLEGLLEACPALPANIDPSEPFTLPQPAECLELLEQLEGIKARCSWPGEQPFRIVARAESSQLRLNVKSAADWFSASAELAVDETLVLDLKRLFELMDASPDTRFLEIDSGQFLVLTNAFRRQLEELKAFSTPGKGGAVRIHPLAAGLLEDVVADLDLNADQAWRDQCLRFRDALELQTDLPSTLQAELRPYQAEGFRWLAQLSHAGAGACLADDMGLGKTVQALALLLHRAADGPALVVAPTSVAANWVNEARRFAPTLNVIEYTGERSSRARRIENPGAFDLVVTTYGLLQNDIDRLAEINWHSAILDEAQAIKNVSTKRARAAFALNASFRAVTTGTPIQNNLMDLYALFRFINPGMLGSAAEFQRRYALPIERDGDAAVRARLNRLISPFVLRRLKSGVLDDLPPRTEITLEIEMSPAEAAFYEALRQRAVEDLEHPAGKKPGERHLEVLAHLTRLRLACCNPQLVQARGAPPSSKLAAFAEVLNEILENRHKVLVFSQFVKHLKIVEAHLQSAGIHYQYLDGQTPARARQKRISAFQAGEGDVFLISLKAGGTGLNLTAADYVIHLDPWWNPAVEDQASDRAHRIGQSRPVTIYRLVIKSTIEAQIVNLHRRKRDLAEQLLDGTDTPARLSAEELLDLFS